jgi:hypothetical protein
VLDGLRIQPSWVFGESPGFRVWQTKSQRFGKGLVFQVWAGFVEVLENMRLAAPITGRCSAFSPPSLVLLLSNLWRVASIHKIHKEVQLKGSKGTI